MLSDLCSKHGCYCHAESEAGKLSSQKKELSAQKEKLKDPEYVKRYARGKFLVIKKGEQVFKLPGGSSEDTNGE